MPGNPANVPPPGYPIGVVSRLTSIHPETLRVWERRYGLVRPQRSERGRRLYSEQDIQRLTLVKQLVDAGHPVSLIAPLSREELETRLETVPPAQVRIASGRDEPCRLAVAGDTLPLRFEQRAIVSSGLKVVGSWRDWASLEAHAKALGADVLLVEQPTLLPDAVERFGRLLSASGAKGVIVVFGFGARSTVRELEDAGVRCLQAPVTDAEIRRACLAAALQAARSTADARATPARRYSAEQLARIAARVPAIACECPQHLVDLIGGLAAFETYSGQCMHRNPKDAEVHAFLQSTAAEALALLEQALARVIEHEAIDVR
jgi:DNA-binding transcriptional MerR regulator